MSAGSVSAAYGDTRTWQYEAVAKGGSTERGVIGGETEADAKSALRAKGLLPLALQPVGPSRAFQRSLRVSELSIGLRILADLCETGMPVNRMLSTFESLASPGWASAPIGRLARSSR